MESASNLTNSNSTNPVTTSYGGRRGGSSTGGYDPGELYGGLLWMLFVVSLLGNSLLLGLGVSGRIRATRSSLFLTSNLAVADLVVGLFSVWSEAVYQLADTWPFGEAWCKVTLYVRAFANHATIGILAVIALERFIKVVLSNRYTFTLNKARVMIAYVWLHSTMTNIPWLIWSTTRSFGPSKTICFNSATDIKLMTIYSVITRVSNYFMPLALTWFAYIAILYQMRKVSLKVTAHNPAGNSTKTSQQVRNRKVTWLCLLILVAFTVAWTPFQITLLLATFRGFDLMRPYMMPTYVLAVLNSCLNPVIYGLMWIPFKNALKQLIGCRNLELEDVTVTDTQTEAVAVPGNRDIN